MQETQHELIPPREALKILTWVSLSGLYIGSRGTDKLTRFPAGTSTLYSRQECEALRDEIVVRGVVLRQTITPKRGRTPDRVV